MGSGPRFKIKFIRGISLGVFHYSFPFANTFILQLGIVAITIGLGKGYDERTNSSTS